MVLDPSEWASLCCEPLFESPHRVVAVLDRELRFVRVNRAYGEYVRREPESLVGHDYVELHPSEEDARLLRRVVETGERIAIRERTRAGSDRARMQTTYWDWCLDPVRRSNGEVVGVVVQLVDVTDHVVARRLAAEREVLLRELHHRVKNNLQIVAGLLRDAKRRYPEVGRALDPTLGRVATIAHIHDLVGGDGDLGSIDLEVYAEAIARELQALHDRGEVQIVIEGSCSAPVDVASPLGMILHELVSNALEHAFPDGRPGTITVRVKYEDGRCDLEVCDDGIGLPERPSTVDTIGLDLVKGLCRQLGGELDAHALTPRGTCCHLAVPLPRPRTASQADEWTAGAIDEGQEPRPSILSRSSS